VTRSGQRSGGSEDVLPERWPVSDTTGRLDTLSGVSGTLSRFAARVFSRYSWGRVLAVYRRSINALFGPYVLTVAEGSVGKLPQGLTLEDLPDGWPSLGIKAGQVLIWHGATLTFLEAGISFTLSSVDLWLPIWETQPLRVSRSVVSMEEVASFAAARAPDGGIAPLLKALPLLNQSDAPAQVLPATARLAWIALQGYVRTGDPAYLLDLIGMGPGLTPSGDDLLRGYTAVRALTGRLPVWTKELLIRATVGTNLLSRQLLWHASRGRVSQRLGEVIVALMTGEGWRASVERALREGHSSGADALVGVLLALWEADAIDCT
jgi:hypothetical protein